MASLAESMFSFYYESTPEPDDMIDDEGFGGHNEGTFFYESRSPTPEEFMPEPEPAALRLPVEILDTIFKLVTPNIGDDSLEPLDDLLSCALTCREDGYDADGRFPKPGRDPSSKYFPTSRCIDFYATRADRHMLQLWRTLLLSCFTVSGTSPEARNATLFPYINYIANLDARTLVMVLTEIMRSQRTGSKSSALGKGAAQYFFEGLLGGLEVSGASRGDKRGDRMIVGGAEYGWASPIYGKEVKVFVGDTALMIMDFLYPHIHHLKGFTIPELGQLRVHEPIRMSHPTSMIYSLQNISRLVISSGWMVCAELGKAIASIRPTLIYPNSSITSRRRQLPKAAGFSLTILDWRFKTHYDPYYGHEEDWETNRSAYNKTVTTLDSFFDALNPNSVTCLDLDFDIRYSRFSGKDLGNGPLALRQSRSIKALRLARMRCSSFKLWRMFTEMGYAGFAPQALKLASLFVDDSAAASSAKFSGWSFAPGFLQNMRCLEFSKFWGMFELVSAIVQIKNVNSQLEQSLSRGRGEKSSKIESLSLTYDAAHIAKSTSGAAFLLSPLASLGSSLTYLKLQDTDIRGGRPGTVIYPRSTVLSHSPLESLTRLRTLILTGDVSVWLLSDRLLSIVRCMRQTIEHIDICVSSKDLSDALILKSFAPSENLQKIVLRAWDKLVTLEPANTRSSSHSHHNQNAAVPWIEYQPLLTTSRFRQTSMWPVCPKVTVAGVLTFLEKKRGGLKEFGLSKAFCADSGEKRWEVVQEVMTHEGGRFLPAVGKDWEWDSGLVEPE